MNLLRKIKSKLSPDLLSLTAKADAVWSIDVRMRYSTNGYCKCYTCDKVLATFGYFGVQCGHFLSRRFWSVRFHKDNCRPQCYECNCAKNGNLKVYRERLLKEIGKSRVDKIEKLAKQIVTKREKVKICKDVIKNYGSI